jgi:hypothetical protein
MAYSDQARELRRCSATTKRGQPCSQYAVWGDPARRCSAHGGRVSGQHVAHRTACQPCTCEAYAYPHRPGSGLCQWPNEPRYYSLQRPGIHAEGRQVSRALLWGMPASLGWARYAKLERGLQERG